MNLNHLRSFAALADAGSFAAAARRLDLPSSTLSDHVAALEQTLGLRLVQRTTRAVRLTAQGEVVAAAARQVARGAEAVLAQAAAARGRPAGRVRLALPFALAQALVAAPVADFLAEHPAITVDLILSNRREDLLADGIDLALRVGPAGASPGGALALTRRVLARADQALCAAPDAATDDLAGLPFFGFAPVLRILRDGRPVTLTARMTANDPQTLARAAARVGGLALCPVFVGRAEGLLPLPDVALPAVDIALIALGPTADQPAAALLAAWLGRHLPPALRTLQEATAPPFAARRQRLYPMDQHQPRESSP